MLTRLITYGAALTTALFLCGSTVAAPLSQAQRQAKTAILHVWGHGSRGRLGIRIAYCESTWRTWARNGQHLGLFQMGSAERRRFGHGRTALVQARAALRYFNVAGWHPWLASWGCWHARR